MTERLRLSMYGSVTEQDIASIMATQIEKAKAGDLKATKTVLDYLLGGKVQKVHVEKFSMHTQLRQEAEDRVVDQTVKQIEQLEPVAHRVHRLLSMVMDKPPNIEALVVLGENHLEQTERWATAQAAALRQAAKGKKDVVWPDRPAFIKE
jgi:ABC-type Fe3+ transport system substrate-binding protein